MPSLFDVGFNMMPSVAQRRQQLPPQPPGLMAPMGQPQPQQQPSLPQTLFGGLEQGIQSPLFLAGIGLMGGGSEGLTQGLRTAGALRQQQAELQQLPLERMMKEAQIELYRAKAAGKGVEAPSNVREWEYFNRLSPDQQQQYLTMKRAEKYLDTETGFVRPNPVTGEVAPVVTKDVAGAATQRKAGELAGQAQSALPLALAGGDRIITQIDALMEDPGLSSITGPVAGRLPNVSGRATRAQSRLDQVLGGAFLQAYNDLRGAGAISEREGAAAKDAYTRLQNQTMGTPDYKTALGEFRAEVVKLMGIARQRAGQGTAPPAATGSVGGDSSGWSARELD